MNLGSATIAEIIGAAGFDWALIDLEHGAGDEVEALNQMRALAQSGCCSIVRVESNHRQRVHRVLDFGAHGIMFPRIETPEEAAACVAAMRYPPAGVRGVAFSNRASHYGDNLRAYLDLSPSLLCVIQIESPRAVANVEAIAATQGVDVLFIGPSDLSHSLGQLGNFDNPDFVAAIKRTGEAARTNGKAAGVLLPNQGEYSRYAELGFRFVAATSDAALLNRSARAAVATFKTQN